MTGQAMLAVHPVLQAFATLLSLYVLWLGFQRFRVLHLNQKATFAWKRHAALGLAVLLLWLGGMAGGLIMARLTWPGFLITGDHGAVGLTMAPLILFGLATGWYMDRVKAKRKYLPLLHGLVNLALVLMALVQFWSGWQVYRMFVLGIS